MDTSVLETLKGINASTTEKNNKIKELYNEILLLNQEFSNIANKYWSNFPPRPTPTPTPTPTKYRTHYDTTIELPLTLDNFNIKNTCYILLKDMVDNDKTNREKWERVLEDEKVSIIEKLKIKFSLKTGFLKPEMIEKYNEIQEQMNHYEKLYDTF
jgi:hypothetical protein